MKEAVKLRVTRGARGHTYDWIDFTKLFHAIKKIVWNYLIIRAVTG